MSKLRLNMMMSLDGYVAGPGQSPENPFGIGGMQLNEWESLEMKGGTVFHFVTDGIESALEQARKAAGEKDVSLEAALRPRSSTWSRGCSTRC